MIERHHYFKLKDEFATDAGRRELSRAMRDTLAKIAGVEKVTTGLPADEEAAVWDVALRVEFSSMEAFQRYRSDPAHRDFADNVVSPRVEVRKIWNFEVN